MRVSRFYIDESYIPKSQCMLKAKLTPEGFIDSDHIQLGSFARRRCDACTFDSFPVLRQRIRRSHGRTKEKVLQDIDDALPSPLTWQHPVVLGGSTSQL
jgi:hypothetical protein